MVAGGLLAACASAAGALAIEAVYRWRAGIPLSGSLPTREDGTHRIATFRKSANPLLVYEPIPGARSRYTGVANAINAHGMRGREVTLAKPPGTFRIAVLGDSLVYGYGVELEDTWAVQLERLLTGTGRRFEVLSFGVPGYSTQQETELYRVRARGFDPDLVLLGYNLNDEFQQSLEVALFDRAYFSVAEHWYFVDALRFGVRQRLADWLDRSLPRYRLRTDVFEDLAALRRVAGEDTPVAVVVFPLLVDFRSYPHTARHARVARAAAEQAMPVLDLLPAFRRHWPAALRAFPKDREHPNPRGYRIAARATLGFLERERLIPVSADGAG